jgi:hypothetical protein
MKTATALLICCWPLIAQQPPAGVRFVFFPQTEPLPGPRGLSGFNSHATPEGDDTLLHVWHFSNTEQTLWGCDVLLRAQPEEGVHLASFQPLTFSGFDVTKNGLSESL